jgi:hypothetical protein
VSLQSGCLPETARTQDLRQTRPIMNPLAALPGRRFVRFERSERSPLFEANPGDSTQIAAYRVVSEQTIAGAPCGLTRGDRIWRVEGDEALEASASHNGLVWDGVTTHLQYTTASERSELLAISAAPRLGHVVMIPIAKSAAWWALAQDERQAFFRKGSRSEGHTRIGMTVADRIFRRLFHARYQPHSAWDFFTYFEFAAEDAAAFREMLATLRDPERNPEWAYVVRESEIWMQREI